MSSPANIAIPFDFQTPYSDRWGAPLCIGDMVLVVSHDTVDHVYGWDDYGLILSGGTPFNSEVLVKVCELPDESECV